MSQLVFTEADLQRNLKVYGWVRMLSARVFLPLIAIYLSEVAHLSLAQIGVLATVAAVVSLVGNIPSGYYADRRTRRASLMTGSGLAGLGTLIYVIWPTYPGSIAATAIDALGYSFLSGAGEALMHDALVARERVKDYVKVMGRAQSFAMVGNVVLVGLVPLTYSLDKRLPFLCGTIAYLIFIIMASTLHEPPRPQIRPGSGVVPSTRVRRLEQALRQFVNWRTIWFLAALGLLGAVHTAPVPFLNLARIELGMPASYLGLMYAAGSLLAAAGGWYLHYLNRLPLMVYVCLDVAIATIQPLTIGLTRNIPLAVAAFIIAIAFWRFRGIIYQDQLLRYYGRNHHKATLISIMGFFRDLQMLWLPVVIALVIATQGYAAGLVTFGLVVALLMPLVMGVAFYIWRRGGTAQA